MDDSELNPSFGLEGLREYTARLSPPRTAIVKQMLQRKEKFRIEATASIISIGPAAGDVDVELLSALPQCRRYIGVEMDASNAALLETTMKTKFPQIESTVVQGRAELWEGPVDQVDLVFLSHVLYYVPRVAELLQQVVTWIKPGGLLITMHVDQDVGWIVGPLPSGVRVGNGCSHPLQTDLLPELRKLKQVKVEDVIKNPCMFDIRCPNLHAANVMLERECSIEEMHLLFEDLKSFDTSGEGRVPAGEALTVLVKVS